MRYAIYDNYCIATSAHTDNTQLLRYYDLDNKNKKNGKGFKYMLVLIYWLSWTWNVDEK